MLNAKLLQLLPDRIDEIIESVAEITGAEKAEGLRPHILNVIEFFKYFNTFSNAEHLRLVGMFMRLQDIFALENKTLGVK